MSDSITITGRVEVLGETQTFGSGFTKREIVIGVDGGKYPDSLPVEFTKDKIDLLDGIAVNDLVTVEVNLRGSKPWFNPKFPDAPPRYFLSLNAWRLTKDGDAPEIAAPSGGDDIPF